MRRQGDEEPIVGGIEAGREPCGRFRRRLLLDSRGVDVRMSYTPIFVTISSLKPLFFNGLKNELRFLDHMEP
jgi:hypothetical protein